MKRITESLEFYFKKYFSVISHIQRSIAAKEEIRKYNNINQGLIVIDFHIGCLMRKFREAIKHEKVKQMVEIGSNFQEILYALMQKFVNTLRSTEAKYKKIIEDEINFGENSKILENVNQLKFVTLMNPYFKRFIKKKVLSKQHHKLAKEDIVDFFKFYSIKYESNSAIVLNAIKCKKV